MTLRLAEEERDRFFTLSAMCREIIRQRWLYETSESGF